MLPFSLLRCAHVLRLSPTLFDQPATCYQKAQLDAVELRWSGELPGPYEVTFDSKPLGIKLGPVAEDPGALQRYSEWIRHHWQNPMEDGLRRDIEGARRSSVQVVTLFKRITYKLVV